MSGSYLGPEFSPSEIKQYLSTIGAVYERLDESTLMERAATLLAEEKVLGWFDGRMEFGPRALGARSILGDPRSPRMQAQMNVKIKFRESFRPFAPSVLRERLGDYFDLDVDSPYMLLVAPVREERRTSLTNEQRTLWGIDKLSVPRSGRGRQKDQQQNQKDERPRYMLRHTNSPQFTCVRTRLDTTASRTVLILTRPCPATLTARRKAAYSVTPSSRPRMLSLSGGRHA